jgi:hypothetical protein
MADEITYTIAELEAMTLTELRSLARSLKINSKQRKADLLEDVSETLESAGRLDVEEEEGELADIEDLEDDEEEETEEDVEEAEEEDEEELEADEEEDEELEEDDEDDEEDPVPTPEQLKAAKERHPSVRGAKAAAAAKKAAEPSGDTYTAKQVATRIGTDAKTLRKFFRSDDSTIEPVGQGGRYEFDKDDMPAIKAEFEAWQVKSATRRTKKVDAEKTPAKGRTTRKVKVVEEEEIEEVDEELEFDEDEEEELTDEDLDLELEDEDEE